MQPTFLKAAIRVLGSLIGLFGVSMLGFGVFLFLPSFITSGGAFGIAFAVFGILLGVYFTRVGYLVWFRWSPLAVRHVVGTLAFLLLGQLTRFINPRPTSPSDWSVFWHACGFSDDLPSLPVYRCPLFTAPFSSSDTCHLYWFSVNVRLPGPAKLRGRGFVDV